MAYSKEETDFILKFGANLRKIRESKEMSMEDLANSCDMEYSQISRIERGKINTKISTTNALAKGLKVPLKELFDFKD